MAFTRRYSPPSSATPDANVLLLVFPSLLRAVKAIFTLGFILTFISVFSAAVVHLNLGVHAIAVISLLGYDLGFSDLSRFRALLVPLGCTIRGVPYQIPLIGNHFSWSLYQKYIGLHYLFVAFLFSFYLPTLMCLFQGPLLGCPVLCFSLL